MYTVRKHSDMYIFELKEELKMQRYIERYNHNIALDIKDSKGYWERVACPFDEEHAKQLLEIYQLKEPEYRFRIVPPLEELLEDRNQQ